MHNNSILIAQTPWNTKHNSHLTQGDNSCLEVLKQAIRAGKEIYRHCIICAVHLHIFHARIYSTHQLYRHAKQILFFWLVY